MFCCWVNDSHCKLLFLSLCRVSMNGLRVLSIPSVLRCAEWLSGRFPTCKIGFLCVRAGAKPKRRRSAAQIFAIWYWGEHSLRFYCDQKLANFVSRLNKKKRFHCRFQWRIHVLTWAHSSILLILCYTLHIRLATMFFGEHSEICPPPGSTFTWTDE